MFNSLRFGCIIYVVLALLIITSYSTLHTVDINFQAGITVSSAQIHLGLEPSRYFRYLYLHYKNPILLNSSHVLFPLQSCSIELLGNAKFNGKPDIYFPTRPKSIDFTNRNAVIEFTLDKTKYRYDCFVQQMFNPTVAGAVHLSLLAYFCPVKTLGECFRLDRRNPLADKLNVSLVTYSFVEDDANPPSDTASGREKLDNYFIWNVLPMINRSGNRPDMALCATFCYGSNIDSQRHAIVSIAQEWFAHYSRLNMLMKVYDGSHYFAEYDGHRNVEYHPYCMFNTLGIRTSPLLWDPFKDGYKPNKNKNWETDAEKMVTYTQCRMELAAVYGIEKVLVVDLDEFLYCYDQDPNATAIANPAIEANSFTPSLGNNYPTQRSLVRSLVQQYEGVEISFPQLLLYKRSEDSMLDCIGNRTARNESIFRCLSSMRHISLERPKLKKNMHTNIMCPFTNYHNACLVHRYHKVYDCTCPLKYPPSWVCGVIHFERNKDRYLTNVSLPECEMVQLTMDQTDVIILV